MPLVAHEASDNPQIMVGSPAREVAADDISTRPALPHGTKRKREIGKILVRVIAFDFE